MDYTSQPEGEKIIRAKKMMLWFGIVGLSMMFAGLTSAYIVSKARKDWLTDFDLPQAFYISTAVIILSSLTMILAKRAIKTKRPYKLGYFWEQRCCWVAVLCICSLWVLMR